MKITQFPCLSEEAVGLVDKNFTYHKKARQAVDAPVEKCVLTINNEENVYE
jgi:hypothetical protein